MYNLLYYIIFLKHIYHIISIYMYANGFYFPAALHWQIKPFEFYNCVTSEKNTTSC